MSHRIRLSIVLWTLFALSAPVSAQGPEQPILGEAVGAETAAEYYEKALVANNLGDARTAYIYLKNALKEDPLLLPAHLLLGKIYLSMGQGEQAEKQLRIADGLGAHRSLIQNSLARAYLMQGRPEQLIDELFPIGTAPEEDAELLALRGEAYLDLEQYFDAQRSFTQAWETNPRSADAILGRVHVLLLEGELERALTLVKEAVEVGPGNPRAWYLKGTLASSAGDYLSALSDYEKAAELLPSYFPAQIGRITLLLRLLRLQDAAKVVGEISELFPNDPRTHYLDAVVQMRLGNDAAAEAALSDAYDLIRRFPSELIDGHMPTLLMAGLLAYDLKQWQQAEDYLGRYLAAEPDETGPRVLLARIALEQQGATEKAIRLLEPAVERTPDSVPALSVLADAYMRTKQHLKAAQLLRDAGRHREQDLLLRTQRALNEFGLGRQSQAIAELSSVYAVRPDLGNAGASLVVMQLLERNFETAKEGARKLMLSKPDDLSYINLFGVAAQAAGDPDAAQWAFDLALVLDPAFYAARLNLGELLIQRGQPELARGQLQRVLDTKPDDVGALLLLARTYEADDDLGEALKLAERAAGADPGAGDPAVYKIEILLRMGQPEKALEVAEDAEVRARNPDDTQLLAALSRAYIAGGRLADAQTVLRRSSSLAGYDARQLLALATLQREAGDLSGALWSLQKATEGEPEFLPTRIKYGEFLTQLGRTADAIPVARALAKDYPDEPYGEHLMGLIYQQQGEHARAFERFTAALAKRHSPLLAVRAYEAKRDADGTAAAVDFLEHWSAGSPADSVVMQTLAEGYYALGQRDRALKVLEQAKATAPDNAMLLNDLAVIYQEIGDERALTYARRAYEALPAAPEIGDTLGWILVQHGEYVEGLKYLRDARARAASNLVISYHIAVALKEMGRTREAIDELAALLRDSKDQNFTERAAALQLLDQLRAVRSAQSG